VTACNRRHRSSVSACRCPSIFDARRRDAIHPCAAKRLPRNGDRLRPARLFVAFEQLVREHLAELGVAGRSEMNAIRAGKLRCLAQEAREAAVPAHRPPEREEATAEAELDAEGAPIDVVTGPTFAAALAAAGVGVMAAAAPVLYLDVDFFAEVGDE
jgi:hypothetical protein